MMPNAMLAHNVFFTLKDRSPEARQALIDGCREYLTDHPGTVLFACGPLVPDLVRPVNDRDFDVGLHVVFRDRAAHDLYQKSFRHIRFMEKFSGNWAKVRVFDTDVQGGT